jgi:hypothetical protein
MKNIYLLPTDKPSRLYLHSNGEIQIRTELSRTDGYLGNNQHIYITSDKEIKANVYALINGVLCKTEIKEGKIVSGQLSGGATMDICKTEYLEIILTTDQDLIKDGVQAIDDEFLEWFVKNPSCQFVEVDYRYDTNLKPIFDSFGNKVLRIKIPTESENLSKILIPKEEQKQHIIDIMKSDEELGLYEQTKCYCGHTTTCDCGPEQEIKLEEVFNDDKKENIKKFIDEINNPSEPNQALKDAAERLKGKELFKESNDRARKTLSEIKSLPIQERSYSEEEVGELVYNIIGEYAKQYGIIIDGAKLNDLFERFKKK